MQMTFSILFQSTISSLFDDLGRERPQSPGIYLFLSILKANDVIRYFRKNVSHETVSPLLFKEISSNKSYRFH
jgi:hypothetical protein